MVTRAGVVVTGVAAVLLPAGVASDYPELVMLGLACVAAMVVAAAWMLARPKLVAEREIGPGRVQVGAHAYGVLTVTNVGRRRSPQALVVDTVAGRRVTLAVPSLAAAARFETVYPLPTGRRGRHRVPPVTVVHTDPLRLLRIGRGVGRESVLYVHPRAHDIVPMPLGGPRDLEGPTSAGSPQGGVAFHSLRDYHPGDDWRRIHWKSTARLGALMVRHNVVPDDPRHLVLLDTSEAPYDDDSFEEAVRVAASLCVAAARAGFPVTCRVTEDRPDAALESAPARDGDATAALDLLAGVGRTTTDRGLDALTDLVRDMVATGDGAALTVVTGRADPARLAALTTMRAEFSLIGLVQVGQVIPVPPEAPSGVLTVDARDCAEFAVTWNRLASR